MYKIGVIGHIGNIQLIEETATTYFKEVEVIHFESSTLDQLDTTIGYLKSQLQHLDGLYYTGLIPYELVNHAIHTDLPSVYIEHDQSKLQRTLLEASLIKNYDISRVSIDSYSQATVDTTYQEIGLSPKDQELHIAPLNVLNHQLLEDLYGYHRDRHLQDHTSFAITGISNVYEQLVAHEIPALLIKPTSDAIKHTLHNLLLQITSVNNSESQIVVISIEIDIPNEYNLLLENEYQLLLEKNHVSEEVYQFTQRIQGAVVETGTHNYQIFSTRKHVESETNHLQSLPVLRRIKNNTSHTVSIGIGFGTTARQAKYNASTGLNKALKKGGNQAYIVSDSGRYGPILADAEDENPADLITDSIFQIISNKTGISINSVYRIHCIKEQSKKDLFTSKELAFEFGTSPRSMNRIIGKLEAGGYITVEGCKIINGAGRPSRILKLHF